MATGAKIDFNNVYNFEVKGKDLRSSSFLTELRNGDYIQIKIEIDTESHEMFPNVYNLSFGPLDSRGRINDKVELTHLDYSKVFSSILFAALTYLKSNPTHYLGIDGSNNNRAHYYWRLLQHNFDYLDRYFEIFGIKYYVRITRYGKTQYDNPFDFEDIYAYPDRIIKMKDWPEHLYNYFTFKLKTLANH